jgi:hypothetical protein
VSLDQLLFELTAHYRDRGFPDSALVHLRWTLVANTKDGNIRLATAYPNCSRRVESLLGHFKRCPQFSDYSELASADAVFGFACGYRMKKWSNAPTIEAEVKANRLLGANNAVLALQAQLLHLEHKLDLFLQFEIARALSTDTVIAFTSSPKDQGTNDVAREFLAHAASIGKKISRVVVVAHRYHFERCRLVLQRMNIIGLPTRDQYSGFDLQESQPRAMSPEEMIVNDFASMAGMAPDA